MTITFRVDDVKQHYKFDSSYEEPAYPFGRLKKSEIILALSNDDSSMSASAGAPGIVDGMKNLGVKNIEAWKMTGKDRRYTNPQTNGFIRTVYSAYNGHCPLTLSPDDIWLAVIQGVTKHIEQNPEDARKAIVNFDGKKTLTIHRNHWTKGSPDNDWEGGFAGFSDQIAEYIGKKRDLFDPSFTTTTPTAHACNQVQMMAALAPYFDYRAMTMCGIPTMTLLGDVDDWKSIKSRVNAFREFYPAWAADPLENAMQEFVNASMGKPDMAFWQNFFKVQGGSGGTPINGMINAFFPYITSSTNVKVEGVKPDAHWSEKYKTVVSTRPNKVIMNNLFAAGPGKGYDIGDYGSSVVAVPLTWNYYGHEYKMRMAAGCFGFYVDGDDLRPFLGWAVGEDVND